ncbi:putative P-loop containing nucleoside triphosphate hydrolase [Rosa chinensis]|uniref:Putative P-loop containing nucleoside triphosphate hydrolase n=1 Tax=Rosa chinensis TaxID=74649 RepID=A0A2P6SEU2_ROSCH|nr:putative P-loop containing nucleoside triphosphate hydrolase [Rosa chinensis]
MCSVFSFDLLHVMLEKWVPKLRHYASSVPIILVGTKLGIHSFHYQNQFKLDLIDMPLFSLKFHSMLTIIYLLFVFKFIASFFLT